MFRNREDAALQLARALKGRELHYPIVLGVPRGGIALGAVLARELGADLDVVLARKIRAPGFPEVALGAVGENGRVYLDPEFVSSLEEGGSYLQEEISHQQEELARRRELLRGGRPQPDITGRSVIVTDDGVATGSTLIAALRSLEGQRPHEVIVAVPVGAADRLDTLRPLCNDLVCLHVPHWLRAVGEHYGDFREVPDAEAVALLEMHRREPVGKLR
jgi:predicted phosphoribosyltransferase